MVQKVATVDLSWTQQETIPSSPSPTSVRIWAFSAESSEGLRGRTTQSQAVCSGHTTDLTPDLLYAEVYEQRTLCFLYLLIDLFQGEPSKV